MILFYLVSMYLLCFLCFNSLINKKFSDFKVYYKICKILGFDSEIIEIRFQRSQKHLIGQWCIDMLLRKSSVIRQKGESQNGCSKETKHANFSEKNEHFLTCAYQEVRHVRFSENLACCFLEIPVLRLALLPYYRGNEVIILTKWPLTDKISIEKNVFFSKPLPLI